MDSQEEEEEPEEEEEEEEEEEDTVTLDLWIRFTATQGPSLSVTWLLG